MSTPITACSLTSFEHTFRNWENQFRSGKPKIIQAQGSLAGKKMFPTGFWFSLSWSCWYFECFVIRYCFSSSGIMTSSAASQHRADGAAGDFILLLFSIKPNSVQLSAYFLKLADLGLKWQLTQKWKFGHYLVTLMPVLGEVSSSTKHSWSLLSTAVKTCLAL